MPPLVPAFTMADGSVAPGYEMPEGWYVPPPQPEPTPNFFAMPMDASPDDQVVGIDELGREVRQTRFGTRYWQEEPQARGSVLSALAEQVRSQPVADTASAVVRALADGVWDGVSAPARAYQGEPITYGDAANTAGMAMLGGMPVRAPQGALRANALRSIDNYGGSHRPSLRDSGSPLYDLTMNGVYPADVYSPNGLRYYSTYSGLDDEAYRIIQRARNNPNEMFDIYRSVPADLTNAEINPGDWVSILKQYAINHGESEFPSGYHVLQSRVPARELYTSGDSWLEWGWDPTP